MAPATARRIADESPTTNLGLAFHNLSSYLCFVLKSFKNLHLPRFVRFIVAFMNNNEQNAAHYEVNACAPDTPKCTIASTRCSFERSSECNGTKPSVFLGAFQSGSVRQQG